MGNKAASGVNKSMNQSFDQYNTGRQNLQGQISSGLTGAQANSDAAFNAALGGYQGLLGQNNQMANQAIQAGANSAQGILGLGGPGNPWAGGLGRDIRARENSVLPAMYERVRDEQTRLQNLQGGYNPGFTDQMAKLTRDQSRQASENVLNTEINLGERSAAAQAAQAAFGLQQQQAAGRARQGGFGSASGFGRNSLSALQGMYNLRGQTPGEVAMYLQAGMGNLGGGQQGALGALGQMQQYNPNVSTFDRVMGGIGSLAGAAAPFMGGFGGFGGGGQQRQQNYGPAPYGPGMYGQQ